MLILVQYWFNTASVYAYNDVHTKQLMFKQILH